MRSPAITLPLTPVDETLVGGKRSSHRELVLVAAEAAMRKIIKETTRCKFTSTQHAAP
jgi:hypothetical protein